MLPRAHVLRMEGSVLQLSAAVLLEGGVCETRAERERQQAESQDVVSGPDK